MDKITLTDRILTHLYRFKHINSDIKYNAPEELTQTGIALSLGITRSYASLLLGRMLEKKLV